MASLHAEPGTAGMIESTTHVAIGARHPQIGYLYLDCIPDSDVGYADIYQVVDNVYLCEVRLAHWREHEPTFDGQVWHEWVISQHLSRIDWYDNDTIHTLCRHHGLEIRELREWCLNMADWCDIPVIATKNDSGNRYEAVAHATECF